MSESQERMMAVVRPDLIDAFMQVCAKWDVQATVIGEVTEDGLLTMTWRGTTVSRSRRRPRPTARSTSARWPARRASTR